MSYINLSLISSFKEKKRLPYDLTIFDKETFMYIQISNEISFKSELKQIQKIILRSLEIFKFIQIII